jgi:hypothetical protein
MKKKKKTKQKKWKKRGAVRVGRERKKAGTRLGAAGLQKPARI